MTYTQDAHLVATCLVAICCEPYLGCLPVPKQKPSPSPYLHSIQQRKIKIDLRPAPIKPKSSTLSSAHVLTKPTLQPTQSPPPPSLGAAKEASRRDIEDAEAHGILTPPPPDATWFKRIMHKGIQLAKFYYRGVKLIYLRRKQMHAIQSRIKLGGAPLTRSEHRFIITQKDDVNKVVPFIFIALLLEEVIPLIAIYAPSMLPSTCILPSQRIRIEEKKTEKAIAYSATYKSLFTQLKSLESSPGHLSLDVLRRPGASEAVCGILRLPTVGVDFLRQRRIRRHLDFIAEDDRLLLRDQIRLSEKELDEALEERGFIVQGLSRKAKEPLLNHWLKSVQDINSETVLPRLLSLLLSR
ncbi:hypothetical protein AMATHDRAFT_74497 [Amanita thiersii Skay4041]|uniref:Letm1 RBD domain-containing protein n=1 Tax=Amanita thiersii Skay4041 TaxID=703135 RepID=A0A2A9NUN6_9AGAR|nr:hypothetical protein AMATHDRAFT_74497 [Amanita thiersii Skay4041]